MEHGLQSGPPSSKTAKCGKSWNLFRIAATHFSWFALMGAINRSHTLVLLIGGTHGK
jgi:hypothetical protein